MPNDYTQLDPIQEERSPIKISSLGSVNLHNFTCNIGKHEVNMFQHSTHVGYKYNNTYCTHAGYMYSTLRMCFNEK